MDKEVVVHVYTVAYYSAMKRTAFESGVSMWMDLDSVAQSAMSQPEKSECHILTHAHTHIYGM